METHDARGDMAARSPKLVANMIVAGVQPSLDAASHTAGAGEVVMGWSRRHRRGDAMMAGPSTSTEQQGNGAQGRIRVRTQARKACNKQGRS